MTTDPEGFIPIEVEFGKKILSGDHMFLTPEWDEVLNIALRRAFDFGSGGLPGISGEEFRDALKKARDYFNEMNDPKHPTGRIGFKWHGNYVRGMYLLIKKISGDGLQIEGNTIWPL
jgi:hypothetical protein